MLQYKKVKVELRHQVGTEKIKSKQLKRKKKKKMQQHLLLQYRML